MNTLAFDIAIVNTGDKEDIIKYCNPENVCYAIAWLNDLPLLKWAIEERNYGAGVLTIYNASRNLNLDMLKYLYSVGVKPSVQSYYHPLLAAKLEIVQWLYSIGTQLNHTVCQYAKDSKDQATMAWVAGKLPH